MAQNSFWSDASLEPKRQYRFRVLFNDNSAYTIKKVKNPAVKITETPHKFLNHTFHYPGRAEWDPIDVTFVDPSAPDQTLKLYTKLFQMGYRSPTDNSQSTFGFTKAAATLAMTLRILLNCLQPLDTIMPFITGKTKK